MVIATFVPATGWKGKTITWDKGVFTLEDHRPIRAADVLAYDEQGHLSWAYDGLREWVGQCAAATASVPAKPTAGDGDQILVFDTETSDLPRDWRRPASEVDNWPRLVQIAWIVCDLRFKVKRSFSTLIRPEGWEIAPGAQRVHGISTKKALKRGVPVATVLPAFDVELEAAGLIVAHNLEFDQTIMTAEFIRAGLPHHFDEVKGFCTMRGTTEYCHLTPKKYGEYKWPKLSELHAICTGKPHAGAHDAMGDAEAVVRCLRALQKAQALQLSVVPKGALTS
jgi:DNA polymerase-3 subunit epsilon